MEEKKEKKGFDKIALFFIIAFIFSVLFIPLKHNTVVTTHGITNNKMVIEEQDRVLLFFKNTKRTTISKQFIYYHENKMIGKKRIKVRDVHTMSYKSNKLVLEYKVFNKNRKVKIACSNREAQKIENHILKLQKKYYNSKSRLII